MWIKLENQYPYRISIGDNSELNLDNGLYTCTKIYKGIEDNLGMSIYSIEGDSVLYVIMDDSDNIGSGISFSSNIPQCSSLVGNYYVDKTKAPVSSNRTIYTDGLNYICVELDSIRMFGEKICPNDDINNVIVYDRNGDLLLFKNNFSYTDKVTLTLPYDAVTSLTTVYGSSNNATLMVTQEEFDSDPSVNYESIASAGLIANEYVWQFESLDDWSGWYSDSLLGSFSPFGGNTGNKNAGWPQYRINDAGYVYSLSAEITENDGVWSFKSNIDNKTYSSNVEPSESNQVYTSEDQSTVTLVFYQYNSLLKDLWHIENGVIIP